MKKIPLISIVIPTYKRAIEVERALKSALNQTYENKEIIIVDDNEEDSLEQVKLKEVLMNYLKKENVVYIKNDGLKGGSGCRNKGIEVANGEFIAFLDDDDEYFPEKIEKQYKYYMENNGKKVGLVYCYALGINNKKKIICEYKSNLEGNILYESMMDCIAGTSLWFAPRKVLLEIGGFVDTVSKQDTITIIKILSLGYEVIRVPEFLVYYYEYIGNKISGIGKKAIEGNENVRKYSRDLYKLLKSKKEIKNIEYQFSKKLLTLYLINNNRIKAKDELKNMIKLKMFSLTTIKGILKYNFRFLYNIFLDNRRKKRFS